MEKYLYQYLWLLQFGQRTSRIAFVWDIGADVGLILLVWHWWVQLSCYFDIWNPTPSQYPLTVYHFLVKCSADRKRIQAFHRERGCWCCSIACAFQFEIRADARIKSWWICRIPIPVTYSLDKYFRSISIRCSKKQVRYPDVFGANISWDVKAFNFATQNEGGVRTDIAKITLTVADSQK